MSEPVGTTLAMIEQNMVEQLFLNWWNLNQPLFQIQHATGTKFTREQMIEIKKWTRHAFDEGSSTTVKEILTRPQLDPYKV